MLAFAGRRRGEKRISDLATFSLARGVRRVTSRACFVDEAGHTLPLPPETSPRYFP